MLSNDDYLDALMRIIKAESQILDDAKARLDIPNLETRTKINVRDHMQFGKKGNATIKYFFDQGVH